MPRRSPKRVRIKMGRAKKGRHRMERLQKANLTPLDLHGQARVRRRV
jgi:hypothetical protein